MLSDSEAKTLAEAVRILRGVKTLASNTSQTHETGHEFNLGAVAESASIAHRSITRTLILLDSRLDDEKARAALDAE